MKRVFYTAFFLLLPACISPDKKPPEGIMSKAQMVSYLIDMHIEEAKISTLRIPEDTVKKFYGKIQQELFRKHGVSDSIYFKSLSYYLYDVKSMDDIYAAVVDSLSLRERLHNVN